METSVLESNIDGFVYEYCLRSSEIDKGGWVSCLCCVWKFGLYEILPVISFDLELPPECDDVYWEIPSNPELEFIQPVGKPSHMAYWHHFIKLLRIAGLVKDHLVGSEAFTSVDSLKLWQFTTRKAAPWLRDSPDNTKKIVMELDSMLNTWKEEVPDFRKHRHLSCLLIVLYREFLGP